MRNYRYFSGHMKVLLLCQITIAGVVAVWASRGDWLSFGVGAVSLAISAIPLLLRSASAIRNLVSVVVALLLAAHIVLGMFFGFYELSSIYDKFMHLIGSTAIAVIVYAALDSYCTRHSQSLLWSLRSALVFSVTLSAGVFWEIFEFGVDQTGLFYAQRGLADTMIDLLADGCGAAIAIMLFLPGSDLSATPAQLNLRRIV